MLREVQDDAADEFVSLSITSCVPASSRVELSSLHASKRKNKMSPSFPFLYFPSCLFVLLLSFFPFFLSSLFSSSFLFFSFSLFLFFIFFTFFLTLNSKTR